MNHQIQQLILDLFNQQMIKFGEFTLKSGKTSHVYADIRSAISQPKIFKQICELLYGLVKPLNYDFICGVPYSALTFASGIAYAHSIPMLLKRKEVKEYGTKKIVEGDFKSGQTCVLIEDVITTGASLLETIKVLEEHGIKVKDICSLVERNQGGAENLAGHGYNVHYVMDLHMILNTLYTEKLITFAELETALTNLV